MGTRTVFQVLDGDRNLIATLFANSSHTTQFAEAVFADTLKNDLVRYGPNALVEKLLSMRYQTDEGNHRAGERIFWLVPADEALFGDREAVIKATHCGIGEELVHLGHAPMPHPAWLVERRDDSTDSDKERCWEIISSLIDREGPGTARQIEYEELACRYGDQPNDAVWQEFLQALRSERESSVQQD